MSSNNDHEMQDAPNIGEQQSTTDRHPQIDNHEGISNFFALWDSFIPMLHSESIICWNGSFCTWKVQKQQNSVLLFWINIPERALIFDKQQLEQRVDQLLKSRNLYSARCDELDSILRQKDQEIENLKKENRVFCRNKSHTNLIDWYRRKEQRSTYKRWRW